MNGPHRQRRAFTLLELLLVLALLVAAAAVAAPAIVRFSETQRLRQGGEVIRAAWARARVQAMKSGRVHVFRFEPDGSHYTVDYWMAGDDALEAGDDSALAGPQPTAAAEAPSAPALGFDDSSPSLPDGVRFFIGERLEDARSARIEAELALTQPAGDSGAGAVWSPPVLFYSDGTTSPAEVVLFNRRNHAVRISLRGLTGVVNVSDVFNLEAQQ